MVSCFHVGDSFVEVRGGLNVMLQQCHGDITPTQFYMDTQDLEVV